MAQKCSLHTKDDTIRQIAITEIVSVFLPIQSVVCMCMRRQIGVL